MDLNLNIRDLENIGEGELKEKLKKIFTDVYGESQDDFFLIASPLSLTLIGEEIDYNGGTVLNICSDKYFYLALRKNNSDKISLTDLVLRKQFEGSLTQKKGSVKEFFPESSVFNIVLLSIKKINEAFGEALGGCDIMVFDKIYLETDQSSLPSFEAGLCLGLLSVFKLKENFTDLIKLCLQAEHEVLNTKRGLSNQTALFSCKPNGFCFFNSSDFSVLHIPSNLGEYRIVIIAAPSNKELYRANSNIRYMECEEGLHILQRKLDLDHLCEITEADYTYYQACFFDKTILRRVKHCITENARVSKAVKALKNGDMDLLGKLLCESHISMRDDFELMSAEQNILFETSIIQSGCRGAKLIGNTEGCYILALVKNEVLDEFYLEVHKRYFEKTGDSPKFFECKSSGVVRIL